MQEVIWAVEAVAVASLLLADIESSRSSTLATPTFRIGGDAYGALKRPAIATLIMPGTYLLQASVWLSPTNPARCPHMRSSDSSDSSLLASVARGALDKYTLRLPTIPTIRIPPTMSDSAPPLSSLRVVEFAGLAPGPFAGKLLADFGAHVLRIDRHSTTTTVTPDLLAAHKRSMRVNLKTPAGVALVRTLARSADVLIDPFRPGVLEKLGLGPETLRAENPRLVYARMAGFRRDGKYSAMAGHDINYIAVSGALSMLGRAGETPQPPGNLLGDFAGGGMVCFVGILLALLARARSGKGQLVEANMVDGAAYLASFPRFLQMSGSPTWSEPRGRNLLDGGAPFYDTYRTKDGGFMAV